MKEVSWPLYQNCALLVNIITARNEDNLIATLYARSSPLQSYSAPALCLEVPFSAARVRLAQGGKRFCFL
jgi:hypothetical protein